MPFIHTKTTKSITPDVEKVLTAELGRAITLLPGKTEEWLMLGFEGEAHMAFRGEMRDDLVFAEVKLLGQATREAYDRLTAALCDIYHKALDVPTDGIYIQYVEAKTWGFDGINF